MLVTPAAIQALRTTFSTIYRSAYDSTAPWYTKLATEVPSSSSQNDYGWMANLPKMREWVGERVVRNLIGKSYTLVNKTFELTVGVKREHIEDDNLGMYNMHISEMARQVAKHPDDLLLTLLKDGEALLCHDGQYFFDTDHPVGDGTTQSNYYANGKALNAANYGIVRAAMMAMKGEDGRPLGVMPNLLVLPPALEGAGRLILNADTVPSTAGTASETNIWKASAELLVIPELAGEDTTWYLFDTTRMLKPFVFQRRRAPAFTPKTALTDENVFSHNEFIWGSDCRDNAGFGLYFLAAKAVA